MAVSSTEEDGRVYENARILVALRESLKKLQIYYEGVVRSECPPLVPNEPHPRYFPYRTSFASEDETLTHIRYQRSLEDDARCVTYLANIIKAEEGDEAEGERSAPPEQVVVKFVGRYGIDVHKFLADKGWAPRLRYYGRLRETMGSDEIRRPGQRAAAGLYLESNVVHMVVEKHGRRRGRRGALRTLSVGDVDEIGNVGGRYETSETNSTRTRPGYA